MSLSGDKPACCSASPPPAPQTSPPPAPQTSPPPGALDRNAVDRMCESSFCITERDTRAAQPGSRIVFNIVLCACTGCTRCAVSHCTAKTLKFLSSAVPAASPPAAPARVLNPPPASVESIGLLLKCESYDVPHVLISLLLQLARLLLQLQVHLQTLVRTLAECMDAVHQQHPSISIVLGRKAVSLVSPGHAGAWS